jgi:hypothetical protein
MEFARPIDHVNETRPSFFDLLAKSNFDNLLTQLLKPQIPESRANFIFYGVKAAVDLGMLASFGGTASEVVYGLERTNKRKWLLYFVTLLENHLIPLLSDTSNVSNSFTLLTGPPFKKFTRLLDILVKLAYITADCKSFSLLHFLTGTFYKHSTTDIYERTDFWGRLVKSILIGGQLGIFLIQSGVFDKLKNRGNQIFVPSTAPDISKLIPKPHPEGYPPPQRAGICPLCLETWANPVVITSGYVYCRKCIKNIKGNTCPITRTPINHLIPLFL